MVRVPRGVGLRTRSGPEGSSLKRCPAGAAGAPGPEPMRVAGARRVDRDEGCTVLQLVTPAGAAVASGAHSQRLKISHERFVAVSLKPGGTATAWTGSCESST